MQKVDFFAAVVGLLGFIITLLAFLRDLFDFTLPWSPRAGMIIGITVLAIVLAWALIRLPPCRNLLKRLSRVQERAYMQAFAHHSEIREVAGRLVELEAKERQRARIREPSFLARLRQEQLEAGDFGQRTSTLLTEGETDEELSPMAPPISLFEAVTHPGNLVITGEPGSGKTTALQFLGLLLSDKKARRRYLGKEMIRLFGEAFQGKIPVFIRLQDFRQDCSILDLIRNQIQLMVPSPKASGWLVSELDQYLSDRGAVLLLDSLDGMMANLDPSDRQKALKSLEDFINARPNCKAIVSSRVQEYTVKPRLDAEFTIQELSSQQVLQFLKFKLGSEEDAQAVIERLKGKQLHDFGRTPLTMTILAFLHAVGKISFERLNRATLFREYMVLSVERESNRTQRPIDLPVVETALADLALAQREGRAIGHGEDISSLYNQARSANLLKQYPTRLEFWHEQLREYFAAMALLPRFIDRQDFEVYFEDPAWAESLVMMAGLLNGDDLTRLLEGIYGDGTVEHRLLTTARCIGEQALDSKLSIVRRVQSQVERMLASSDPSTRRLGCRLLGELGTEEAMDRLRKQLIIDASRGVKREATAQLLALDYLLYEKLQRDEGWQRFEAAEVMRRIADQRFADVLLHALCDSDWRVRQEATRALGIMGVERAAKPLLSLMKGDPEKRVRWTAIRALGQVGDLDVLPVLSEIARSVTDEVSKPIAFKAMQEIRKRKGEPWVSKDNS
jgi:energy-coupling factor transporter ATP-binding protein EcfA2